MSAHVSDRDPFEMVAESFLARYRAGQRPSVNDYAAKHPELADQIRRLLPALVMIERDLAIELEPGLDPTEEPDLAGLKPGDSRLLGDYRIVREIGRGGMGLVYEAQQISLGRRVALKVLPRHVLHDRKALQRFHREAKAAARLHHMNIVPVFEIGQEGEHAFYTMQFIAGEALDHVIDELARLRNRVDRNPLENGLAGRRDAVITMRSDCTAAAGPRDSGLGQVAESLLAGRLATGALESAAGGTERIIEHATNEPLESAESSSPVLPGGTALSLVESASHRQSFFRSVAQIGRQVAQGLSYAHSRGIVHRDIKPSNLLLDTAGVVWITDFGLAKAEEDGLTATGDILGTLRYMAPERFSGAGDARSDVYSLGLTLYELLALRPAFETSDRLRLVEEIKSKDAERLRSIDDRIPRDLETIVHEAIDKDPARRYSSAESMAEDLRRFLDDEPIRARQSSTVERYWRWAHRNPWIATLGAALGALLVAVTIASLIAVSRFADLAKRQENSAAAERSSRVAAQAETYRAMLSEARALRAGHPLGWRDNALGNLARLTRAATPRRDLVELRSEAVACVGGLDVVEVARLDTREERVWSLAFSPDSQTLLTATLNGDVDLCDVTRKRHLWCTSDPAGQMRPRNWPSIDDPVIKVEFLPDGTLGRIAWSHRVEFLDATGRLSSRPPILGGKAQATGLEMDRPGRRLAVGWDDGRIEIHDAGISTVRTIAGSSLDLRIFALSPDGRWLAHRGPNDSVQIRLIESEAPPMTLGRHRGAITSLTFSPDGSTLASTSLDHSARLWDVTRLEERIALNGHNESVTDLAFSPDGNWIATTSNDYSVRIWEARTGQTFAVLPGPWFRQCVAFSPDGRYVAVDEISRFGTDSGARLYQLKGRREPRLLAGHAKGAQCLAAHPTLPRFVSGADDRRIIVWDPETGRAMQHWKAHERFVGAAVYSPDGTLLATGEGDFSGEVKLWDAATGSLRRTLLGHAARVHAIAFDATGRRLATMDGDGVLFIWDVDTGRILRRESEATDLVRAVAFTDDGRQVVTGTHSGLIVYDLAGNAPPRVIPIPQGGRHFVIDRTRNDVVVAGADGALTRVSLRTLAAGERFENAHDGAIEAIAISRDGRMLATGGRTDGQVLLRDAQSFVPLFALPPRTGIVKVLEFDSSGRWLAMAGAASDITLWDLDLVHAELAAIDLAWDQPVPPIRPATNLAEIPECVSPAVPTVWRGNHDPTEIEAAKGLFQSGLEAFRQGRGLAAIQDLHRASEQLRIIRRSHPSDPSLAREHSSSLAFLAASLRDAKRAREALAPAREGLAVVESLKLHIPMDFYNMACYCATVSVLNEEASPAEREQLEARAVRYLRIAFERDPAAFVPQAASDRDLDPLRNRADFRSLMADPTFPLDPFARP